jgi:hypothetical protein
MRLSKSLEKFVGSNATKTVMLYLKTSRVVAGIKE